MDISGGNDLSRLFNKNLLKISYSTLPNLQAKINIHNKAILSQMNTRTYIKKCNCQKNRVCPLKGNCVIEDVIYKAEVLKSGQSQGHGMMYVGMASGLIKKRISNHVNSFKDSSKRLSCELGKYIWSLKDKGIEDYQVTWEIIATEKCFSGGTRKCQLCLREKLEIIKLSKAAGSRTINRRTELGKRCIHRFKHLLGYLDVYRTNDNELRPEENDHNFHSNANTVLNAHQNMLSQANMSGFTKSGRRRNV